MSAWAESYFILIEAQAGFRPGMSTVDKKRWKLSINVSKTKVIIFRRGGILSRNLSFTYDGQPLEIVKSLKYLGVVFTTGGSFSEAQTILAGQAQKAIFKLNSYLYKFTSISPKHKLDLFDKLITPILNYSCEVWGFIQANAIERVHLQFCKKKNFWVLKSLHKMILYMANWGEQITYLKGML